MAPEGLEAVGKAGGVFRLQILSRPLLVDFMCLSILLKHQNPAMASPWSCQCLAGPLSQSCFPMLLFSWPGRRGGENFLGSCPTGLFGAVKRQQLGAHTGPGAGRPRLPSSSLETGVGGHLRARLFKPRRAACPWRLV